MKRKQYTPEFKAKVVLQVLREEKTLGEIAADNELNPNQIRNWKREFESDTLSWTEKLVS